MATAPDQTRSESLISGADAVIESLVRNGVEVIFAYPGGASMPLHQSLTRFGDRLRTILPRHEQGGGFAAQGYARTTGKPGVCMATSGPGALNLVTAIADAKLDSIPLVAITGQVGTSVIGTDAFQETPIVEVCRGITKHHYLVTDAEDIPRVMKEAFFIATTGRPGPVLVDLPKDIQLTHIQPDYDVEMNLPGYNPEVRRAHSEQIAQVAAAIRRSKRPVIYAGGGVIAGDASENLRTLVEKTGIPVTMTLMGLGAFPGDDQRSLDMLGMHGSVYANYAVDEADLLIAVGVRFDDRVTGKVAEFAQHGFIVHIDIDPSEINKNKLVHIPIVADVNEALSQLNEIVEPPEEGLDEWHAKIAGWKEEDPFAFDETYSGILAQEAIAELSRLTAERNTVVAVGVGQHQMWAAQFYKFRRPRTWLSSSGLGTMGFGLPAAMGAKVGCPDDIVIDIDGDGSILMNIQEFATCTCEKIPVKVLLLNNQHLGMVVQWEDRFFKGNRAHTYLGPVGNPEASGQGDGISPDARYPDFVAIAQGFGWQAETISEKKDLESALTRLLDSDGPALLDVQVPYQEQVLPMIPSGMSVRELIKK
ncbi:MAG TPA: biosynthetic-type acetolactate synthase large subunit [Planctomycetaceae bacterium]|nr:acetolactate synthase, large subunit, biosynthetic type [Planctomycetaceae bacterium]RZO65060.1 MAG: biosynthetic-type acetolactate synthase large subunit [Phycisphaeraceae bacterium]HAO72610.1 biosynthetic-type acetolactate synthase large subunit [Planctomycetaceae bacterium]HAU48839.1 biosynthetic-type acetolactate synthase large subunit [Planctomycetaceae bacterium]HBK73303.1 biosynthetic-type acetolactate synthase large subunit [Planctomycetaceae bacterium]